MVHHLLRVHPLPRRVPRWNGEDDRRRESARQARRPSFSLNPPSSPFMRFQRPNPLTFSRFSSPSIRNGTRRRWSANTWRNSRTKSSAWPAVWTRSKKLRMHSESISKPARRTKTTTISWAYIISHYSKFFDSIGRFCLLSSRRAGWSHNHSVPSRPERRVYWLLRSGQECRWHHHFSARQYQQMECAER